MSGYGRRRFKLDDFELYKFAREFRKAVYRLVKQTSSLEKYALAGQMRRAALSVTNNIAEGHRRWHYQENIRFCRISRGSVDELIDDFNTCHDTCHDEGYGDATVIEELKPRPMKLSAVSTATSPTLRRTKQGGEES